MKRYKVANHIFEVSCGVNAEVAFSLMDNYASFEAAEGSGTSPVFSLSVETACDVDFVEEIRQEDEGQEIICGRTADGSPVFEFYCGNVKTGTLVCQNGFHKAVLYLANVSDEIPGEYVQTGASHKAHIQKFALNNSLMVLFALATARTNTVLFHSAVVMCDGRGFMFLGKSGTGKSTHARMWLKRFADSELLNDDNPVVRLEDDGIWVYGSPWSGKTPCYKNKRVALGGIVDLSQAPENRIRPIKGIEAYMALVPSISGMRWDKSVADGLHATENRLAQEAKMFHLKCLPNEDAAEVCYAAFDNSGALNE